MAKTNVTGFSPTEKGQDHEGRPRDPVEIEIFNRLAHEPASVTEARETLSPLERAIDRGTFEILRLLGTELVTNSVRHGRAEESGDIELSVRSSSNRVRVEVADSRPGFTPLPRGRGPTRRRGGGCTSSRR